MGRQRIEFGGMPAAEPAIMLPAKSSPLLQVDCISVARGDRLILRDVSLTVDRGEVVALVGASGAGKSTLLATLSGLLPIRAGRIAVPGIGDLASPASWRQHRRLTASMFQDLALVEQATALHNVLIGLAERRSLVGTLRGWRRRDIALAVGLLRAFGIGHLAHSRADRLSGGERRRVGAARALIRGASLLLADEPFNSLDPELARNLVRTFAREAVNGTGLVVALHQAELLPALAHRVIGLEQGCVIFDSPAADVGRRDLAMLLSRSARARASSSNARKEPSGASIQTSLRTLSIGDPP